MTLHGVCLSFVLLSTPNVPSKFFILFENIYHGTMTTLGSLWLQMLMFNPLQTGQVIGNVPVSVSGSVRTQLIAHDKEVGFVHHKTIL